MDFKGQHLSEALCMYIILAASCIGFLVGYLRQDFGEMMTVFSGGAALAALLTVPNWPVYNKHPVKWLPPREDSAVQQQQRRGGGGGGGSSSGPRSKKKAASWSNLWGAF